MRPWMWVADVVYRPLDTELATAARVRGCQVLDGGGMALFQAGGLAPLDTVTPPDGPLYVLTGLDRGDHLANWSPHDALPAITAESRTPLLLTEGIHWALQQPAILDRNHCFMTIGSRRRKPNSILDSRTPAIWISNGTGRDGPTRRNAPKIGWCWSGNHHTWLGFAAAKTRHTDRP